MVRFWRPLITDDPVHTPRTLMVAPLAGSMSIAFCSVL